MAPLLNSIEEATPGALALFLAEAHDRPEHEALERELGREALRVRVDTGGGNYAMKINRGVSLCDEALLFLAADDLAFRPGWLEVAKSKLTDGVGVVGTNDLCNPRVITGEHSTHSLVTREYAAQGTIDEPDKLLHEGYLHEFVDDEFVETAKFRGAYAHADDAIVEHLHPMVGKAPTDALYAAQRRRMRKGRPIYAKRRQLWMSP